jgi:hypothetical protein
VGAGLVGKTVHVAQSVDHERDTWNRIYLFESEDLRDIAVSFVELTEERCRIWLTGRTQDPNQL